MEERELTINEKLYSFEGVIGRHGYFLNIVIIWAISFIVMMPYTTYMYTHATTFVDLFNHTIMFAKSPALLKLWVILGVAGVCTLSVSNIFRRLNDIFGNVSTARNIILSSFSVLSSFFFILPLLIVALTMFISFILSIVLLFTKGKITGELPYDYRKEFNWGAFWGTWIWGLINKTYIPLFELLLWWTPLGFYFQLYCGLKGNEWAYKNKNCTDIAAFNKSQEGQSAIFTVLSLVIFPILYFIIFMVLIIALTFLVAGDTKQTPDGVKSEAKIESTMDKILNSFVSMYFERYEFSDKENKFYVTDKDWNSSDFKDKKDMLELAATKSAEYRREKFKEQYPDKYAYFSKTNELPRTKIYSATSGKLLGEFIINEEDMNGSFTQAIKSVLQAYKFYKAN